MKLQLASDNIKDYLVSIPPIINFDSPLIKERTTLIRNNASSLEDRARMAFEISRDEIHHSFDTKNPIVTIEAEDVLKNKEGICFAKAHLLASLLRALGIPTGFCYQKVLRKTDDSRSGWALHGLNALYLKQYGWFRVDPRGNKPGINAQFSPEKEQLAYPIRPELGEVDYPNVFTKPLEMVIEAMERSKTSQELFFNRPESI
ncbi:MAG TPA: transglutaminase family protein [Edaphocola sp.]|nr:transglutaminase family protein [Edaphocola sp.]